MHQGPLEGDPPCGAFGNIWRCCWLPPWGVGATRIHQLRDAAQHSTCTAQLPYSKPFPGPRVTNTKAGKPCFTNGTEKVFALVSGFSCSLWFLWDSCTVSHVPVVNSRSSLQGIPSLTSEKVGFSLQIFTWWHFSKYARSLSNVQIWILYLCFRPCKKVEVLIY